MGRKKQPHYRVVVAESEHPRDGRFVESLGFYRPLSHPARLSLDLGRVDYWIGRGAQPSGTVKSLIGKARRGGDGSVVLGEVDAKAEKAKRAEMLAGRRAVEKKAAEAKAAAEVKVTAPTEVPQDRAEDTGGSSSQDASAAEARASGEAEAVRDAEDSEPAAPPHDSVAKSGASGGTKKSRSGKGPAKKPPAEGSA